jgi:Protein of unknown function (DUF3828)
VNLSRRIFLASVLLATPALAQAPSDVLAPLNFVYSTIDKGRDREPFSKRLQALYDAAVKRSDELNEPVTGIDFDYAINGQDFEPGTARSVRHRVVKQDTTTATVETTFRNGGPNKLIYSLVLEGGQWLIDEVRSVTKDNAWTLSALLIQGAKTPKS